MERSFFWTTNYYANNTVLEDAVDYGKRQSVEIKTTISMSHLAPPSHGYLRKIPKS